MLVAFILTFTNCQTKENFNRCRTPPTITVDAAGTLIRPWPSVGAVYAKTARSFGLTVQDEEVDQRFYEVFGKSKDSKITSGEEKDFWKKVVLTVFEPYSEKATRSAVRRIMGTFRPRRAWRLAEGAKDTLSDLRNRGYPGRSLEQRFPVRSVLEDLAIDSLFEKIFISSEMGVEKPDLESSAKWKKPSARSLPTSCTSEIATHGISKGPGKPDGMPCCSANPSSRNAKSPPSPNYSNDCHDRKQASRLHRFARQLESMPSGVRAEPDGGYLAYLDFSDVIRTGWQASRRNLPKPCPQRAERQAELPGMDRFLRYEFLAPISGFPSGESGPCHTRWLVRTPENGYPSSSRCNPRRIRNPRTGS